MLVLRAPAKVNLFLDVLGKRKDGYHNLSTVFLKINLYDTLYFKTIKNGIKISSRGYDVPNDSTNLVYKAAAQIKKAGNVSSGVHIRIIKRIPVGAGLGGGSSDAANTLIGLNRLWKLKLSQHKLFKIGRSLGADVPLFLIPDAVVLGKGRGDVIRPVIFSGKIWMILVYPDLSISTKEVYAGLPVSLTKKKNDVKLLICALKNNDLETVKKTLFNRLESVAFKKYRYLETIKRTISAQVPRAVLMSGSGSVIFGIVKNREEAMRIRSKLQGSFQVMVVRSL